MSEFDVAFIGTGANPDEPSVEGFAMAYQHAAAYSDPEQCNLVGCADIVRKNAEALPRSTIDDDGVFEDYEEMLATVEPDVVSICTPPATHADLVVGTAESGVVDAIHCEKPMALTLGGAQRMARVCEEEGVQLTFNHAPLRRAVPRRKAETRRRRHRRSPPYRVQTGATLRQRGVGRGQPSKVTGDSPAVTDSWMHLTDKLAVEVYSRSPDNCEKLAFEAMIIDEATCIDPLSLTSCSRSQRARPLNSAENALNATEIIFAGYYESARRRGRVVDLPLDIEDNPLESMVDDGQPRLLPSG